MLGPKKTHQRILHLIQSLQQKAGTSSHVRTMIQQIREAVDGWESNYQEAARQAVRDLAVSLGVEKSITRPHRVMACTNQLQAVVDLVEKNYRVHGRATTNSEIFALGISNQAPYNAHSARLIRKVGRGQWRPAR